MTLMIKIASTKEGALRLLESGFLSRLADCSFLKLRASQLQGQLQTSPLLMERYHMVIHPVFHLLAVTLSSLGSSNRNALNHVSPFLFGRQRSNPSHWKGTKKVGDFIDHHEEFIFHILDTFPQRITKFHLMELKAVTGILAYLSLRKRPVHNFFFRL